MTDILSVTADAYHADQLADQPALSASIAHVLCSKSPAHAWTAHPKLNPAAVPVDKPHYDIGKAAHAALLEGVNAIEIIDAENWRTKASQEAAAEARTRGKVPLLAAAASDLWLMVAAVNDQLAAYPAVFHFNAALGEPEQTLVWDEDGVACKARLDWLTNSRASVLDLKTTSRSAHPRAYERRLCDVGGDIQAAWYLRGVAAVTGAQQWADFAWIVVETSPPFALSVIRPAKDLLELGSRKCEYALRTWRECLERDEWPAYGSEVAWASAPEWEVARWFEREQLAA